MTTPDYLRPKSLPEALRYLQTGTPLAGGTSLAPEASRHSLLVDLQDLGLNRLLFEADRCRLGATLTLQSLVDADERLPRALREAGLREAGCNLRNRATIGGTLVACTGRSPLATALLSLHAQVHQEPGPEQVGVEEVLARRGGARRGRLIIEVAFRLPERMAYAQVARSPADRPIVCAVVTKWGGRAPSFGVALGGFGASPVMLVEVEQALAKGDAAAAADEAARAYAQAEDSWASGEYRAHLAAVLVRRLAAEVSR
jgi:carbon-monoxide dehydrogenase medium subunit